jgi:23S rRNA pseudouridine2605 synthase
MATKTAMTLDRVLSRFGIASRTASLEVIRAGRLKVNGKVERDPERWVWPERDVVHLDGKWLRPVPRTYLLLYKPKGVITSHGDPDGRKTIYDLLGASGRWVAPVGRLDKDTSGLLLLTNDTEFGHAVMSPESQVPKTYMAKLNALMSDEVIGQLARGVEMKRDDWARPQRVRRLEDRGKYTWLEIVLTEGKNREVRRMVEAIGFTVIKLVRTRIGPLTLEGLQVGKWRHLTQHEITALQRKPVRAASLAGSGAR